MFIPGETQTHAFIIPFSAEELTNHNAKIYITYRQNDDVFFEREVTSGWENEQTGRARIAIDLTQEESLLFKDDIKYYIQLNVEMDGARMSSKLIPGNSGIQLKKEVIS